VWSVNDGLSGNLRKPAVEVSGRFPNFSLNKKNFEKKIILINKKFGNLPETSAAGFMSKINGIFLKKKSFLNINLGDHFLSTTFFF
jgi:hypothetical protein